MKILHLIGPTSVGKGFIGKLFRLAHKDSVHISSGQMIRDNPDLLKKYKDSLAAGELLPDAELFKLAEVAIEQAKRTQGCSWILTDGLMRTVQQVKWADSKGLLLPNSTTIVLGACKQVCHSRAEDRIRRKPDGVRFDEHAFEKRYTNYTITAAALVLALRKTKTQLFKINADNDIENIVFPEIMRIINTSGDVFFPNRPLQTQPPQVAVLN